MVKFKGFSLLESLLAMTILSIVFTVSLMTVEWLLSSHQLATQLRANCMLHEIVRETRENFSHATDVFQRDGLLIEKKITPVESMPGYYIIEIRAMDNNGHQVSRYDTLVFIP